MDEDALGILPGEQSSAPAFASDRPSLSLHGTFGRPDQVAQGLPTNRSIPIEKPLNSGISHVDYSTR
jgi:hypothetical protein